MTSQTKRQTQQRLQAEERVRLSDSLEASRGDLEAIVHQLVALGWTAPPWFEASGLATRPRQADRPKVGRKPAITTLQSELWFIQAAVAHLHATYVEMRGESAFALGSGMDRLAALGVVSPPIEPSKPLNGRPRGRAVDYALVYFTHIALTRGRIDGVELTQRQALDLACAAMRERDLTQRESFEPEELRKARRRIANARKSPAG